MNLAYAAKLDLQILFTNVKAQKVDNSLHKTFEMVIAGF